MPSPASLGFCPATPLPPGAPPAVQAESGPDLIRVGSRPYLGFARGGGRLRPHLRRSALAWLRPCRLARLRAHRLKLGLVPPKWAPCPTLTSLWRERLCPHLRRSTSTRRRPYRLARLRAHRLNLGLAHLNGLPARHVLRPVGRGCILPCVARLRAPPMQPRAPSAARAESEPDPSRMVSCPTPASHSGDRLR